MQLWAETLTKRLKLTENIKSEDYFSSLCLVQYSQWKATNFFPWGVGGQVAKDKEGIKDRQNYIK